ncbi:MAG TPA: serine protease [Candidatus Acidoferrales bacterium]|nr:serine protease [Candidatus Acidoferrales bacterium]
MQVHGVIVVARNLSILIACSCVSSVCAAQKVFPGPSTSSSAVEHTADFSEIVVPITSVKVTPSPKIGLSGRFVPKVGISAAFGTGFCLDAACRFIVTNYHVAMVMRTKKIKGERIIQRYLATGPDDEGATANSLPNMDVIPFATKRDLAMFELRRSLPHHHGLAFSLDELQIGQEVDIYGFPKGIINPLRKLTRFPATFKAPTTSGLLAFEYQLSSDKPIRMGGASGGIVVDRKTEKIVGILSQSNETMALAVPVETLVDFVTKVQPFLAQRVFPATKEVSPVSADVYPKFIPQRADGLQHRPEEPYEVRVLREKAQLLGDNMRDFIAVQSFAWGSADKEPDAEAAYEVRVIDGDQRFRRYPDGKKQFEVAPFPRLSYSIISADEWSQLPKMVGTAFRLQLRQAPDIVVNGRQMKVFQYYASAEDNLCGFDATDDFVFFKVTKSVIVSCYGEVWTDEDTNIIRMSKHLELSEKLRGFEDYHIVLTYGWLKRANEPPWLVPLTIFAEVREKQHIHWCRGQFTDYHVFNVRSRLVRK